MGEREAADARAFLVRHGARQRTTRELAVEDERGELDVDRVGAPAEPLHHDAGLVLEGHPASRVPAFLRVDHDGQGPLPALDRKSTRLNSSHPSISYAVFCLKKKTIS